MSLESTLLSLEGLSVGDAFGECFFRHPPHLILRRVLPPASWRWTDDTHMALSIVAVLREHGRIEQDALALHFATRYIEDPHRGYGPGARHVLARLARGEHWHYVAPRLFNGGGSYGNGAAMRAAPIGGYFIGDPARAAGEARRSAVITHTHHEGQAGAMAVAAAAAIAATQDPPPGAALLLQVLDYVPSGLTAQGIEQATNIPPDDFEGAVRSLGTGRRVSAQDTVPFCLWCAAYHLDDYAEALWQTVAGLGDRDTTCAIVGGIVALSAGEVPSEWVARREQLPNAFSRKGGSTPSPYTQ